VNSVILSVMLATLCGGQAPLPTAPDLPIPPDPAQTIAPAMPGPQVGGDDPAPVVPSSLNLQTEIIAPPSRGDVGKPPPFRLIEANPPPDTISLNPAPLSASGPLPAVGTLAPGLILARAGPASVKAGEPFSYEIVARNAGAVAATQIKLDEELPPGTRFLGAQPIALAQDNHLSWTVESLAPGAERHFKVEVEANGDGEWKATATLTVAVTNTMKATVTGAAQQALVMTGPGTLPVGHPVAFRMNVTNTTGATLTDATLRVRMAPGLQHLHGDAIEASLGDLAAGQSKELTLDAITAQTGRLTADVTLLCGKKTVATAQAAVVAIDQPTLGLRQIGPMAPPVGGENEFKLEVMNRSATEVRDVEVIDVLPEGLQFTAGDSKVRFDAATRTLRWSIGSLAPGQARQFVFRAQVRGTGAQINRISARATEIAEAQLHTVLRLGGGR
jgi:uncharacterized repeat protein (TIGR01451 family)